MTIDFDNVDIQVFIKFVSELTGRNFVIDDKVKGKVTVISPNKISVDEVYKVFESVLEIYGFTTVDAGDVTKVVLAQDARGKNVDLRVKPEAVDPADKIVTQILSLQHASPDNDWFGGSARYRRIHDGIRPAPVQGHFIGECYKDKIKFAKAYMPMWELYGIDTGPLFGHACPAALEYGGDLIFPEPGSRAQSPIITRHPVATRRGGGQDGDSFDLGRRDTQNSWRAASMSWSIIRRDTRAPPRTAETLSHGLGTWWEWRPS